jgi:hypothetical protein
MEVSNSKEELSHVVAQAVICQLLATEAMASGCGIYGEQSGTGTSFLQVLQFSYVSIIPQWLSILVYRLVDEQYACQRCSLTPST